MDHIKNAAKLLREVENKNPFQVLAEQKGFNLLKGDKMVISKGFADAHSITEDMCQGLVISSFIDCSILLIKKSMIDIYA